MKIHLIHLILAKIGLNSKEVDIYLLCINSPGGLRVQEIADKTSFKRSSVNLIIERMEAKGFLTHYVEGKRKLYNAQPPESLLFSFENTVHDFKNIIPLLLEKHEGSRKSKIRFFQGQEGIYQMYNESLLATSLAKNAADKEILTISPGSSVFAIMPQHQKAFIDKRIKNRISMRWIAPDEEFSRKFLDNADQALRRMKFFDHKKFPINIEIDIFGDKLAIYNLSKNNPDGTIIENLSMANSMRSIFNLLWTLLP